MTASELKFFEKIFKALGQGVRLKILSLLSEKTFCVCELEEILLITQPAISQHLKILKEAGLIEEEKVGQWVFYSLRRQRMNEICKQWQTYLDMPLITKTELSEEYRRTVELAKNPKVPWRPPSP